MPDRWTPLVRQAQQQDSAAMIELLNEFENLILSAVKRYNVPHQERSELLQESYMGFLKAIHTFDPELDHPFASVAKTQTKAAVWHYVRMRGRRQARELSASRETADGQDSLLDLLPNSSPQLHADFSEIEWHELLSSLSDREVLYVESLVFDGHTVADIARLQGVHRNTVHMWKRQAFHKIKAQLRRS
ncbi:sigma-70 family RNA polymerase sigma factor [Tumebacillus sp. ITR2]|uniref:Sigma-70 family RNA polymerase sigma factor n=1 Tax=Tumebacillus amylolyticus TaxID=2801339 RepID=A0ABS1J5C6_9BACL|nr:sigma-70 family RNA polymerase sigma factor [Tumebacillus amylolyticus]MBL0385467.1 sigma-70 family RNA polymerase sigma factor [Tumebacillus amylolyticus]